MIGSSNDPTQNARKSPEDEGVGEKSRGDFRPQRAKRDRETIRGRGGVAGGEARDEENVVNACTERDMRQTEIYRYTTRNGNNREETRMRSKQHNKERESITTMTTTIYI